MEELKLDTETDWKAHRDRALTPLNSSDLVTTQRDREEFLKGAELLRFYGPLARADNKPQPQQLVVVDMLAVGTKLNAVLLPRRSSKSTTLIALALGRAESREDYRVGILTLTTGKAGRSRFTKDVVPPLERVGASISDDKREWPFRVIKSAGQEHVSFKDSGGSVWWLSSIDDLRGEAFDLIILDEAGEAEPGKVSEVLAAALPTMDTRPGGQIVAAGTAGRYRKGNLLWDWLELGRSGRAGIIEYAMPDETPAEAFEDWQTVAPLVLASHPGVGTLTTLESIEGNYLASASEDFAREYGGIFGTVGAATGILDYERWADGGSDDELPTPPERFGMAVVAHPNLKSAAIVAAWRDDEGHACIHVLKHARGIKWVADEALILSRTYGVPITYDTGSGVIRQEIEHLERQRPRPKFEPQTWRDVQTAAALLVKEVAQGNVRHWNHDALNDAAQMAVKRGTPGSNAWALGRPPKDPDADITPLEAASMALRVYDNSKPKSQLLSMVA